MPEETDVRNYYNIMDQQMKEYSRRYRQDENEQRKSKGAGLLLQSRYVNILSIRDNRVADIFRTMSTVGDRYQRELPGRLFRTLKHVERWVQTYCNEKHVTLTRHFVFVAPVHVIALRLGEDVRTVNNHLKLLGALGFITFVDTWRFGIPYIGVNGIRVQLYRFSNVDRNQVLRLWHRWCNSGGALRRVCETYIRSIFGNRVGHKLYLRPEAKNTIEAKEQRRANREYRNSGDCWQNHKDESITKRHSLYRAARKKVQDSYSCMKKFSRQPVIDENTGRQVFRANGSPLWRSINCYNRRAYAYWNGERHELTFDQIMNVNKLLAVLDKHYHEEVFVEVCKKHRWFRTVDSFTDVLDFETGEIIPNGSILLTRDERNRVRSRNWTEDQKLILEAAVIIKNWFPTFTKYVLKDLFSDTKEQAPDNTVVYYRRVWDGTRTFTNFRARVFSLLNKIDCRALPFDVWMSVMTAAKSAGLTYDDLLPWCMTDPERVRSVDRSAFCSYRTHYSIGVLVNAAHNYSR